MGKRNTVGFEDLDIYRLSERLADGVWDLVANWKSLARNTVGKQLIRSADSIGANIAEGNGRGSLRDNHRFVDIACGSLYETRHFLRRAFRRKFLTAEQIKQLRPIIEEPGPRLNAYRNSLRARLPQTSNKQPATSNNE
jgi:four helix bundle protein